MSREQSISDRALSSLVELPLVHRYEEDESLECSKSSIASRDTVNTSQYEFSNRRLNFWTGGVDKARVKSCAKVTCTRVF